MMEIEKRLEVTIEAKEAAEEQLNRLGFQDLEFSEEHLNRDHSWFGSSSGFRISLHLTDTQYTASFAIFLKK